MLTDEELLEQWFEQKEKSLSGLRAWKEKAKEDHAFFAGDRMYYTASVVDKGRKAMVVFNRVKPVIDAVSGFFIQLRRKPEYLARRQDERQEAYSTYLNNVSDYVRSNANMDHIESRQDKEMLITGVGAVETNLVYDNNPGGEIKEQLIPYDEIFWDPMSGESNLLDAHWVFRCKRLYLHEALKMFEGSQPSDFEPFNEDNYMNYQWNPVGGAWDKITSGADISMHDLVEIYYYQWWELKPYYRIKNPIMELQDPFMKSSLMQLAMGVMEKRKEYLDEDEDDDVIEDMFSFDPSLPYWNMNELQYNDIRALFKKISDLNPQLQLNDLEYIRHMRRCYYTAILTDRKVFKKFKSADQNGFTIKFKTGDYDIVNKRYFGMVAQLKEPAKYANKALTEILYVIASNSKGGVMYEDGAVEDPSRFEQQWATTKAAIKVNQGALSGGRIQPKANAQLPTGYENVYALSTAAIGEVSVNKEFLGSAENKQVSAVFEQQRVQRASSSLAGYLDNIALFQKEQGRLMITLIRMWAQNDEGRPIRIAGDSGKVTMMPLTERFMVEEYDIDIGESPTTPEQRSQSADLMTNTAMALLGAQQVQAAQAMMALAIDYYPIKEADKFKFKEAIMPKPTPEQMEMQKRAEEEQNAIKQLTMEGHKANIAKTYADAQLKGVQAAKTQQDANVSRVDVNKTLAEILKLEADIDMTNAETKQINKAKETRVVV